jgi:hypothetical protein
MMMVMRKMRMMMMLMTMISHPDPPITCSGRTRLHPPGLEPRGLLQQALQCGEDVHAHPAAAQPPHHHQTPNSSRMGLNPGMQNGLFLGQASPV